MTDPYVELHCHSNYSFLEGASHPEELVARARELEMPALAITDRNGLYGAVKFFGAAQRAGIQPIIGTVLTIDDGTTPPKDRVDYDRWGERLAPARRGQGRLHEPLPADQQGPDAQRQGDGASSPH